MQLSQDLCPVILFHGDKPVAEGLRFKQIPQSLEVIDDDVGTTRKINITPTRSLVTLTRVLVPTSMHALHHQSIQWIFDHGAKIVVTTSTLRSRSIDPPIAPPSFNPSLSSPAPPLYSINESTIPEFIPTPPPDTGPNIFDTIPEVDNDNLDLDLDEAADDIEDESADVSYF
jgi:hypothetical protein